MNSTSYYIHNVISLTVYLRIYSGTVKVNVVQIEKVKPADGSERGKKSPINPALLMGQRTIRLTLDSLLLCTANEYKY